jgi:hypothetical protein
MPTVNPRINVTLSPSLYGMVGELAKQQRISKSMVLRELLEASEPALAQVVAMLKAADDMNDAARQRLKQDLCQTIEAIESKVGSAMELAAGVTADLVAQAESIRGRRPGVGKRSAARSRTAAPASSSSTHGGKRPPSSNRGVKSSDITIKTIASSPLAAKPKTAKAGVKNRGGKSS